MFEQAGIPCARHRRLGSRDDVPRPSRPTSAFRSSSSRWPAPVRADTFRVEDDDQLTAGWPTRPSRAPGPVLLEEFLVGEEHSFDSVVVDGQLVWHSIGRYLPTPLDVLENPWIQWCVLLPRDIDGEGYDDIRDIGARAVAALGLRTGFSHLEWFRRPDGSVAISEVGARPPARSS